MQNKIKISKEEFETNYEVEGITGEIEVNPTPEPEIPDKQDTTPEILTESELEQEKEYEETLNWNEEKEE